MEAKPRIAVISSLLMFVLFVFGGLLIGGTLGQLLAWLLIPDASFSDMLLLSSSPASFEQGRWALLAMQGVSMAIGFGVLPFLYERYADPLRFYFQTHQGRESSGSALTLWGLAALITLVAMPFILFVGALNQGLTLPDFLGDLEQWMRTKEDTLAELTKYITDFDGLGQLLFGLLVVAVLPGVAEEYCFRGILQKRLGLLFNNPHVGIILSALIFSAIHVQFYGFFPRFLLGALFGYLFYWSGSLKIAMFAHFINNASALLAVYFSKSQTMLENPSIQEIDAIAPLLGGAFVSLVLCAFLLHYFYKTSTKNLVMPIAKDTEQD